MNVLRAFGIHWRANFERRETAATITVSFLPEHHP
jgi:hypothetical protein